MHRSRIGGRPGRGGGGAADDCIWRSPTTTGSSTARGVSFSRSRQTGRSRTPAACCWSSKGPPQSADIPLDARQRASWLAHLWKACARQHHTGLGQSSRPHPADAVGHRSSAAHAGQFSKLFARMAPRGRVYAFEPSAYARSVLTRRCGSTGWAMSPSCPWVFRIRPESASCIRRSNAGPA